MDSVGTQGPRRGVQAIGAAQSEAGPSSCRCGEPRLRLVEAEVVGFAAGPGGWYRSRGKRVLDLVVGSVILLAVAPVMAVIWAVLRVVLGPDVVITQTRVGRNGTSFGMYKFRTMRWSRRRALEPFAGPDRRTVHKADHDPRHTSVGLVLRKASLDELPQLFNVLRGEMSLVGPRPELAEIVDRIGARGHRRHEVLPGMTGEWQITGRQDGRLLHECLDDDLPYLDRVTFRNDVAILAKTLSVVAGRGGR